MKAQNQTAFFLTILLLICGIMSVGRLAAQEQPIIYTITNLHSFTGTDGANPMAGLIHSGGTLYGTTYSGGAFGCGTVFAINLDGTGFTNLHSFSSVPTSSNNLGANFDGANPQSRLVVSGNTLFGTATYGGSSGCGTIFAVNTDGSGFTNLHNFTGNQNTNDGANPCAGMILCGTTFYGTAKMGGAWSNGCVFAMKTDGSGYTNVYSFSEGTNIVEAPPWILFNADGAQPITELGLLDNVLYGSTSTDGPNYEGTVFAVNTDGSGFTNLGSFYSTGSLVGSGGQIYTADPEDLYCMNLDGTGRRVVFTPYNSSSSSYDYADGQNFSGLLLSGDSLYAVAQSDGTGGGGTVVTVKTNGTGFRVFGSFSGPAGSSPAGKLLLDGNILYGTAQAGGLGYGTIFSVSTLSPSDSFQPLDQNLRFFRIAGPSATTIISFLQDGSIVWSNAQPGQTYTVQVCSQLPAGSNWQDFVQLPTTNAVNTNKLVDFHPPAGMAFIPAGSFTMGDTLDGETDAVPTNVTVSAFYIETNLVTGTLWEPIASWAMSNGYSFYGSSAPSSYPFVGTDWYGMIQWCNARSQMEGLTPVYYMDTNFTQLATNAGFQNVIFPKWAANGYRLPTEAEWEKAARGGLQDKRFPWGNYIAQNLANYYSDGANQQYDFGPQGHNPGVGQYGGIMAAGSFPPNNFGLYDMAGNAFEFCWDVYSTPYAGGVDPRGPPGVGERVMRGGFDQSYYNENSVRCAYRSHFDSGDFPSFIGFRCVRKF